MDDTESIDCNRKLAHCPSTANWSVPELIKECPCCSRFMLYCCVCAYNNSRLKGGLPCHHHRIVFTDGACINNGRPEAQAGVGVACGSTNECQLSKPITDMDDNFPRRSSQRAELYAAILGVEFLYDTHPEELRGEPKDWVIATDSEYVVKGITEWLPIWRKNGWRTSKGVEPANLDLFLALDRVLTIYEAKNVTIEFWHIPREHNKLADRLAKAAAAYGDEASL